MRALITIVLSFTLLPLIYGCTASIQEESNKIMLVSVQLETKTAQGPLTWTEFKRTGKMRKGADSRTEEFIDFMDSSETQVPDSAILDIWDSAKKVTMENQSSWSCPANWLGNEYEQLNINFCHETLGWQNLSLAWDINNPPKSDNLNKLVQLIKNAAKDVGKKVVTVITLPNTTPTLSDNSHTMLNTNNKEAN